MGYEKKTKQPESNIHSWLCKVVSASWKEDILFFRFMCGQTLKQWTVKEGEGKAKSEEGRKGNDKVDRREVKKERR